MTSTVCPLYAPGTPDASPLRCGSRPTRALLAAACLALGSTLAVAQSAAPPTPAPGPATRMAAANCPPLLQHTVPRLQDEQPQALCQYAGQVLLVVNTASYCGYTPQYEGLETLHARFANRGLVVMGFPSNDFNQEDPDAKKIAEVCFNTYGVRFPMFATTRVKGAQAHPLFAQLTAATGQAPAWNFNKYLVDRQGRVLGHFPSRVSPTSPALVAAIEQALAAR